MAERVPAGEPRGGTGAVTRGAEVAGRRDGWWSRAAALAGVAVLPLVLAAATLADVSGAGGLNPGSSDERLVEVFAEFRDRLVLSATLQVLAAVAILVFLGPLWARVRVGSPMLAVVAVCGGVAVAVLQLGWAVWSLGAAVAADFADAGAARFLMVSGWETARIGVGPYLALVGAVTLAGLRHRVFGPWFNLVGVVFAALLVVGLVPASPAGLMGMLATLWVFGAALVLAFSTPPEEAPLQEPWQAAGSG